MSDDYRQRQDDYWYWRNKQIDAEYATTTAAASAEEDTRLSGEGLAAKYGLAGRRGTRSDPTLERLEGYLRVGQAREAFAGADLELSIDPENAPALVIRAQANLHLACTEAAVDDATNALGWGAEGRWAAWAHAIRGEAYLELNRPAAALADAETALEISPGYAYALVVRGAAYRGQGRMDEARASVEEALEISPFEPFALFVRAILNLDEGHFGAAAADATMAMGYSSPDTRALFLRAEAYRRQGLPDLAVRDARQILEMNPGNERAQRLLRELDRE